MGAATERFRFDPPAVALDAALRWVLVRAFGPPQVELAEPEGVAATTHAGRLGLAPRIAARHSPDRLTGELGAEAAAELRRQRALAVAQGMRLQSALAAFDEVAAGLRVPYAPLKGQALRLGGFSTEGARASADVDLLVPEAKLDALQAELRRRGFVEVGERYEHQAPALRHADGGAIELHRVILGVRPGGKGSATFEELVAGELLGGSPGSLGSSFGAQASRPRGDVRLPQREILAAHAIVHVLAQHALAPHAYPGLLLVADLLDLGFRGSSGRATLATILPWIERSVSFEETEAALDLATALAAGEAAFLADGAGPWEQERPRGRRLLDHFLAGASDPRYAESLKARALEAPLSDRSKSGARAALVAGALLPPRQVNTKGEGEGRLAYLGRLLARPFDLLRRWRSAKSASRR